MSAIRSGPTVPRTRRRPRCTGCTPPTWPRAARGSRLRTPCSTSTRATFSPVRALTAGLDLCPHQVRRDLGAYVAGQLARRMVVAGHRPGGQAQFVDLSVPEGDDDTLAMDWAASTLDQPLTVDAMARRSPSRLGTGTWICLPEGDAGAGQRLAVTISGVGSRHERRGPVARSRPSRLPKGAGAAAAVAAVSSEPGRRLGGAWCIRQAGGRPGVRRHSVGGRAMRSVASRPWTRPRVELPAPSPSASRSPGAGDQMTALWPELANNLLRLETRTTWSHLASIPDHYPTHPIDQTNSCALAYVLHRLDHHGVRRRSARVCPATAARGRRGRR